MKLFKVNDKETTTTSMMSFWCLYNQFLTISDIVLNFPLLILASENRLGCKFTDRAYLFLSDCIENFKNLPFFSSRSSNMCTPQSV